MISELGKLTNNSCDRSKNRICPSRLPHYYNISVWFYITHVGYGESFSKYKLRKVEGKVWKIRFEKIDPGGRSWWAPKDIFPLIQPYGSYGNLCKMPSEKYGDLQYGLRILK